MTGASLYRTASVVFILFAAGHTFGFLNFTPPTAAGIAARDAMNNVHFTVGGRPSATEVSTAVLDFRQRSPCFSRRFLPGSLARWWDWRRGRLRLSVGGCACSN
jgi:hypothetical protein